MDSSCQPCCDCHDHAFLNLTSCRTRAKGEINGKSANLNNALKNIVYQEYASKPGEIPIGELIVVFDADMQVRDPA